MKKILFYVFTFFFSASLSAQTVDITLNVDMSQYTGSFTTAYISGNFNGWSGTSNIMTDQGNGIWQGTITVNANDSIEYKFSLDDWAGQENFAGGESCTKTTSGFTNRFLTFGSSNITVPTVCWESCTTCPTTPPATVDITFLVNTANVTVDPAGLYLAGGGIFGNPGDNPMTDSNGDGIYEITITKSQGISGNYTFTNGNCGDWSCKENIAGLPCADANNWNDRILPTIWNDTTILTCFATCATDTICAAPPSTVDLTLSVDMSQYTGTFTTAYINGSFNNWNGNSNPLADQGNGIWQGTITVNENDSIEYKFTLDGWTAQENFVGGESCTKTTGGNINRFLAYGNTNTIAPTVCWESCAACVTATPTVDITFLVNTANITVDPAGLFLAGGGIFGNPGDNPMTDANGDGIYEITITKNQGISGNYIFLNGNCPGWGCKENLTGLPCADAANFNDRILPTIWGDTTIMTCYETCATDTVCPAPASTVDLTFSVDLSQYTGVFTTAYINGSFNGWNGTSNPLTDQGNGIWSGTITVNENDSLEYKFTLDGWAFQENFVGGESCTKTTGVNVNRFLAYGNANMTIPTVCWESCAACPTVTPSTVDITVAVDVSQYTGSFTTIHVDGTFNGWSGAANPLTDQGNGLWTGVITVPENDSIEYKFTHDAWAGQENFSGGESCTKTSGGFTNRFLAYGNTNMTLDTVCWNSCTACPTAPPATVDITFLVNSANITVDPTGLYVAGGGIFGNPGDNPMTDANGDGVWEVTITKNQGISGNYIFLNGNSGWGAKENLIGLPCSDPANFDDRILPAIWNDTIIMTCFETCSADTTCPAPATTIDITVAVDMSQYLGTFTTVHVDGTFNGWSGTANPLTDQGNGLWTGTITVPENDSIEYKFTHDAWAGQENFTGGESCTKTSGGFTNRFLAYGNMNMVLDTVCWESCIACPTAPPATVDITFLVNTANITVDPTGLFLAGGGIFGNPGDNPMSDVDGDGVYEITITKNQGISGNYIFLNGNAGWGNKENIAGLPCSDPANFDDRILPTIWNDTIIMTCFETCASDTTCPAPSATVDLTVSVDMSQYAGTFTTAYVSGDFNGWNGTANPLTDLGNGTWEGTITVTENDSIEYKFQVDDWSAEETFIGGEPCTKSSGGFTNRFLTYGNMNVTVPTVCWNLCTACPTSADSIDVTFMVDMRLVDTIAPSGVYLGANFDNWTGSIPMTDINNDSIYEVTLSLLGNSAIEFKFINGAGWASSEDFDPTTADSTCTLTTGTFTNRFLMLGTADISTIAYCYDECFECVIDNTKPIRLTTAFTMMPNPANTYVRLNFDNEFVTMEKRIFLHNSVGQLILNESIDNIQSYDINTGNIPAGMYYITIQTDEGVQTKRLVINH